MATTTLCDKYEIAPKTIPMKATVGDTFPVTGKVVSKVDGVSTAVDLTGCSAVFVVEEETTGADLYKGTSFTMNAGGVTGAFAHYVPDETTDAWAPGKYRYSLKFAFADGSEYTFVTGPFKVEKYPA